MGQCWQRAASVTLNRFGGTLPGTTGAALWLSLALATPALATELEFSGFASVTGGKTFGGCTPGTTISATYSGHCSRYVSDWAHAGVYTPSFSLRPESKVGLQSTATFSPTWSATAQVVARAVDQGSADLEWAYLTYKLNPAWTLQFGRKRLPLSYFSDVQDVGYAYTWVRPPPEMYGWDAVNYNGVNATYRDVILGWSAKSNFFTGSETSEKNKYSKLFYTEPKDVKWSHIAGVDLELNRDWFTARVNYAASNYSQIDRNSGTADVMLTGQTVGKQKFYGVSFNIDVDPWFIRTEYSLFDRNQFQYSSKSYSVGTGYHVGSFTPMVNLSDYRETTPFPNDYVPMRWSAVSLVLRYEATKSSALKFQLDRVRDRNREVPFAGSAKVLTLSYDVVF